MDDKLLAGGDAGSYGSRGHQPESPAKDREEGGGDGGGWTWTKRLRRQRHPSFGAADDERAAAETAGASGECRASEYEGPDQKVLQLPILVNKTAEVNG